MTILKGGALTVGLIAVAFVFATPGTSYAAKKAAAAPMQPWCLWTYQTPVCAMKNGKKQTYANWCYAHNDGAKKVSDKACAK